MTRLFILIFFAALTSTVTAQTNTSRLDIRLGAGASFLGSGDLWATMIENEINYALNDYFTVSGSLAYGKHDGKSIAVSSPTAAVIAATAASFFQGNANILSSPLKNTKRMDIRIGGGLSYYTIADVYQSSFQTEQPDEAFAQANFEQRNAFGFNIIIEDTFVLTDRFLLGAKVFTQPYLNGDINSGVMLKVGVRL